MLHYENLQLKTYKDGKPLYKLMNNAAYGKTMENLRNKVNVKFVSNKEDYLKLKSNQATCNIKYLTMIQQQYVNVKSH